MLEAFLIPQNCLKLTNSHTTSAERKQVENLHITEEQHKIFIKTMGLGLYDKVRIDEKIPITSADADIQNERLPPRKTKAVQFIIVVLQLVIIVFALVLIILNKTLSSTFSNLNNEERKDNPSPSPSPSLPDEVTEMKNQNSAPCEDDWIWYRGKCYFFSTEHDTWRNSQRYCNSHNASLAIIDNKKELDFLFQFKGSDNRWIGVRRTDDNKSWTWTNGTSYNENLFPIRRSSHNNIEYVYLNNDGVSSQGGYIRIKWICNKM
ncbi:uncharacterized protein LOC142663603 [Rhinoderma darwinii]|uniref:uncharacterized protein LOC142663603 n=1 Tax=Rhinoderma darwinii TaxID=43563 RepID=UPI003F670186